jgi:hypothetical protein
VTEVVGEGSSLRRFPALEPLDRWSWAAIAAFTLALVVRLLVAFPVHKHAADADVALSGMCALRVLAGEMPLFFAFPRWGALECYPQAAVIALLGPTRLAQNLTALAFELAFVVAAYLFLRELLGRQRAALGLVWLALPCAPLLFFTYVPNGYPAVMFLCALLMWSVVRAARRDERWPLLVFAFTAGVGMWQSFHTLTFSVPIACWLLWQRPELLRPRRLAGLLAVGAAGAAPWWLFNLRHGFATLQGNFVVQPVREPLRLLGNLWHFFAVNLPELLASPHPIDPTRAMPGQVVLGRFVEVFFAVAALAFVVLPLLAGVRRRKLPATPLLLALPVMALAVAYAASSAGNVRGFEVRYAMPLVLVVAALFGQLLAAVGTRAPALATLLAALVMLVNGLAYPWPWSAERRQWVQAARADARTLELLQQRGVSALFGGYWTVYPFGYLSGQRILAVPCGAGEDVGQQEKRLPPSPTWALLARVPQGQRSWLDEASTRSALASTRVERLGADQLVVLPPTGLPPTEVVRAWRERCQGNMW